MRSRNVKDIIVSADTVMNLMGGWRQFQCCILPTLEAGADENGHRVEIPPDVEYVACTFSFERNAAIIRMSHPSWDAVPDGQIIPSVRLAEITLSQIPSENQDELKTVIVHGVPIKMH